MSMLCTFDEFEIAAFTNDDGDLVFECGTKEKAEEIIAKKKKFKPKNLKNKKKKVNKRIRYKQTYAKGKKVKIKLPYGTYKFDRQIKRKEHELVVKRRREHGIYEYPCRDRKKHLNFRPKYSDSFYLYQFSPLGNTARPRIIPKVKIDFGKK